MESRAEQAQGYWRDAERYAELASSGQRDITNFVHKRLAERFARMAEDLERLRSERARRRLPVTTNLCQCRLRSELSEGVP
jgi:hypothetical protein